MKSKERNALYLTALYERLYCTDWKTKYDKNQAQNIVKNLIPLIKSVKIQRNLEYLLSYITHSETPIDFFQYAVI